MFNINYFKNKYIDSIDSKLENAGGGLKVSINGGELKDVESLDLNTIFDGNWGDVSTLPYEFYAGSAVVLDNEIHILGSSTNSSNYTKHYKYNTSTKTWSNVSTLPYQFYSGSAIVLNNEIHILGSNNSSYRKYHYKYNTSTNTWSNVRTLPYDFYGGSAIVLDNEIHILGGWNNYTKHYSISALLSISKIIEKTTS